MEGLSKTHNVVGMTNYYKLSGLENTVNDKNDMLKMRRQLKEEQEKLIQLRDAVYKKMAEVEYEKK